MKKSAVVVSGFLVVGLVAAGAGGWWWHRKIGGVEEAVRQRLVDPASARFSSVRYHPLTHGGCGLVDAKNLAGQYVGFTPFVLDADGNVDTLHTGTSRRGAPQGASEAQGDDERFEDALYQREKIRYCEGP